MNQSTPVRDGKPILPYSRHHITDDDKQAVLNALSSDHIAGNGKLTTQFEEALCETTGYEHAIVCNSGTAALHLAYMCARVLRGIESIVTTPLTFVATVSAAIHAGLRVELGDINPHTCVLDTHPATNCVPVSYAGYPSQQAYVSDDCHYLVPQMAHHRSVSISVLSFHPVKGVTTAEGGAVLTNDWIAASYCRQLRDHGRIDGDAVFAGFNYRLPDILCALGISQLKRLDESLARRTHIAHTYLDHWKDDTRLVLPQDHSRHGWHLFVIRVKNRNRFRELLLADGIGSQIHYKPITNLPILANYDSISIGSRVDLRRLNEIASQIVSIPLFASMSDDDMNDVMIAVDKALDIMENEE